MDWTTWESDGYSDPRDIRVRDLELENMILWDTIRDLKGRLEDKRLRTKTI